MQVIRANEIYSDKLEKKHLAKIMIDLCFLQTNGTKTLSTHQLLEMTFNLPKFNLLWTILCKSQLQSDQNKIDQTDGITMLAAILDIQVPDLLNLRMD
jgi:hypothetical protein